MKICFSYANKLIEGKKTLSTGVYLLLVNLRITLNSVKVIFIVTVVFVIYIVYI